MKERPILFSGEMVRAILEGRKTVTRRVVKPQPDWRENRSLPGKWGLFTADGWNLAEPLIAGLENPYGQPGDRLWVRETWAAAAIYDELAPKEMPEDSVPWFKEGLIPSTEDRPNFARPGRWRPSIHMPRWASRITLEVTGVRVERLQSITEEGAKAEGIEAEKTGEMDHGPHCDGNACHGECPVQIEVESYRQPFRTLWDSINASRGFGWDKNPYVWVVEFRMLSGQDLRRPPADVMTPVGEDGI